MRFQILIHEININLFFAAYNQSDDPMCQLTEEQRYRLCGLVFHSEEYEGKVKVPASFSMVESRCHYNKVSFRSDDGIEKAKEKVYGEWMILCYMSYAPFDYHTEWHKAYYLSRAYNHENNTAISSNDIFVYQHGESDDYYKLHYYLMNSYTNVRT